MNEEIFKKVTAVIVDKLGVKAEDVKPESEFGNDLGADSLDRVRRRIRSRNPRLRRRKVCQGCRRGCLHRS